MKRILLFLFLSVAGIMQAQIVNIPDPVFKQLLVSNSLNFAKNSNGDPMIIDANNDDEIQVAEAASVWELNIIGDFTSLDGIAGFSNLRALNLYGGNLEVANLTGLVNLEYFNCESGYLTTLIVPDLVNLKELQCGDNNISVLDVSGLVNLEHLNCEQNNIGSLNVSVLNSLKTINCSVNELTSLIFSENPNLTELQCVGNQLDSLDVSGLQNLENLACGYNELTSLDVSILPNLKQLYCNNTMITSLDLSNNPLLYRLDFEFTDLSYVNLKNGNSSPFEFLSVNDNPGLVYVCADDDEVNYLTTAFAGQGVTNLQVNSYCAYTPGGDYNTIMGVLGFSNTGNCNSEDLAFGFIRLNINNDAGVGSTFSTSGSYSFFTGSGIFTVIPHFENDYFTATPASATMSFAEVDNSTVSQNFCITPNGNHPDIDIVIVPFGAQPGFDSNYKIIYRNKGNQMLSGTIAFNYQEDVLDFVSANPSENSAVQGVLTWNYNNLAPFQQREIYVTLNVNGPTETPPVNIDDLLDFTAAINPVTGDDIPNDNVFELQQVVVGSMDPNDITCLEGNSVNPDKIGEYLHYNINFENTGTAPATFIVVKDVIDTAQFDMASLQLINASHPVQAKVTGNKVEFRFDGINLGPGEKGNVVFKIKTLNTLHANDDVTQKADIFFDYNWPIVTNEATTVFEVLSRGYFEKDNSVKVYPNPSNGVVNITAVSLIKSVEIYDVQGRLLQSGSNASLDISGRAAGIYFVKVFTEKGMKVEKIVKE